MVGRALRPRIEHAHVIIVENSVGGHNRQAFHTSLDNEQSIEWIGVVVRKTRDTDRVVDRNVQRDEPASSRLPSAATGVAADEA